MTLGPNQKAKVSCGGARVPQGRSARHLYLIKGHNSSIKSVWSGAVGPIWDVWMHLTSGKYLFNDRGGGLV
jgi:hypothetical protein